MTERLRSSSYANSANISAKMANDLTPRKTVLVLVIVVGCFAVLWPKVFYPMLVGSANQHMKPSPIDKTAGCCDVISETDVNTIKIMSELCKTIIKPTEDEPLSGREVVLKCQSAVLETCGIDISAILQEQVRLGQTVKQILDEIRSLNGSLCLKYNFGVSPWRLGVPHRINVPVSPSSSVRQERPLHLHSELVHPAFRERGRAIPQPQAATPSRPPPRIVEGRPGPVPGMRPTLGGAGHVVPPPKQSTGSMGLIMPIYTIGIVIFFAYTVMKIVFRKQPEALYPPVEPDPNFRREVFESGRHHVGPKLTRESVSSKLVVNAMSALLDEVDQEIESRRKANEVAEQDVVANGNVMNPQDEQPSVKVLGMEMRASCEGGKKWARPESPVLSSSPPPPPDPVEPPQEIFLEGSLPPQSHLLVADSATEAQKTDSEEDPAVVLAGKMTLSVISLDSSENGTDESSNSGKKQEERSSSNVSEEFEKIEADIQLEDQIDDIIEEAHNVTSLVQKPQEFSLLESIENEIKDIDKRSMAELEKLYQSIEIQNIEPITSKDLQKEEENEPLSVIEKKLIEEELKEPDEIKDLGSSAQFVDAEKQKIGQELEVPEELTVDEKKPEDIISTEKEIVLVEKQIAEGELEETNDQTFIAEEVLQLEKENTSTNGPESIQSLVKDEVPVRTDIKEQTASLKEEIVLEKDDVPVRTDIKEQTPLLKEEIVLEKQNNDTTEHIEDNHLEEQIKKEVDFIETTQINKESVDTTESKPDVSSEVKDNGIEESIQEKITNVPKEEVLENISKEKNRNEEHSESNSEKNQQVEPNQNDLSPEEKIKQTLQKLNEAMADLSEFRTEDSENKPAERVVERDLSPENIEDEEIEYEYEDSGNEDDMDEEIRNIERVDELVDRGIVERVNGDDQEQSKCGTASSVTLAENDISDENDLEDEDEDVEVEEIIEYVTDDEEEIIEEEHRNNINHIDEGSHTDE